MVALLTGAAGFLSPGILVLLGMFCGLAILYAGDHVPDFVCAICRKLGSKLSVASHTGSLLLISGVLAALWCYAPAAYTDGCALGLPFGLGHGTPLPILRGCSGRAAHILGVVSRDLKLARQLLFVGEGISGALSCLAERQATCWRGPAGTVMDQLVCIEMCCVCFLGLALLLSFWISGLGMNLWPSRVSLVDNDFYELKLQDNTDPADLLSMYSNISSDEPSVQSMRAGEQNGLFAVSGALRLAHGALKVFTWLTDAKESEKVFSEHVQSCNSRRLLAERGNQKLVEVSKTGRWRLLGIPFSFESTVTVLEDWRDYKATFRQKKRGAMKHFAGFWQVVPVSTEESVVLLYTEAVPGFPVPSLLRRFARVVVEDMAWSVLKDLRDAAANSRALVEELSLEGARVRWEGKVLMKTGAPTPTQLQAPPFSSCPLQLEEKVVSLKDLQKRQSRESKESLLAALEQFRLANVLEEVERQVPATTPTDAAPRGQKRRRGADQRAASSSSAPLRIMSSDMTEPCTFVKRSGQESFPSFRLKKAGNWPESTF
ncbi:unnamed protein product [Symbiodinium sp. KB8]|nr:unnamed protein product [Symbiodinium sp. KB8]